jgi:hypothetical protein
MEKKYLSLDEKPEKGFVSILMVIFGILCLITSGWWAAFLLKTPEQQNSFWLATSFLFLFGLYQIYAGLGYARRYIKIDGGNIIVRQNSFFAPKAFEATLISNITIRAADILIKYENIKSFKLKLGIRYPDLGENIKNEIILYAEKNKIEALYEYDITK